MGRYTEAVCRQCRREGQKLFLKGDRCYSDKCSVQRKPYVPGAHGQSRRGKATEYGLQLREKQQAKRLYGLLETQFHNYFKKADRQPGITGENLLILLERRLDNIVYRMGFASNRRTARQLVSHGHILVNGKKMDIPSAILKKGDVVEVKESSRQIPQIQASLQERNAFPNWIEVNKDAFRGTVKEIPNIPELALDINPTLIVELYSK